jgi:hypothetical protein
MTFGSAGLILVGLLLGLLGPRAGRVFLSALCLPLLTLLLAWHAGAHQWSFFAAASAFVVILSAAVWLVVRWPHWGIVPSLLVALVVGVVPLLVETGSRPSVLAMAGGVVCLGFAAWGVVRPAFGVRLATAAIGSRLVLATLPGETSGWQWPALTLVFLALGRFVSPHAEFRPSGQRLPRRAAAVTALLSAFCAGAVVVCTPELPPADGSGAPRLARLRALAPRGGYLWPVLSETVQWEDASGYRAWDSLDVRYLTGSANRGLFLVPGSSRLLGRFSLNPAVETMRAVKDEAELQDLEAAAQAIVSAVRATAPGRTPGLTEAAIARSVQRLGLAQGCTEDSFPPVVASGARAASIHAAPTDAPLRDGDLVVVDVGCSVHHYASDFTRTFPVGGHFTAETRRYYGAVYAAQQAALAACRPGAVVSGKSEGGEPSLDAIAHRVLQEQLGERGYSHHLGHGVGLFVHDVDTNGPLQPGMVLTLEPGLYLPGKLGIRIEDTYWVTQTGCEALTHGLSAEPDAVEAFLAGRTEGTAAPR